MSTASPVIELDQVSLSRDGVQVLTELSLRLDQSRIGLIGHNGSGKSSLVRLLNGLLPSDTGRVSVHGQDPGRGPEAMAATVGFIFQNPDHQLIFPTVIEELTFGLRNQGCSVSGATEQALALLRAHGHEDWAERPVHSLSEGQKQLVCIFAVLLLEPGLLILDEPFSALDLPTRFRLLELLHGLPQQILMISHELDTLADFDRLIWLEDGRVRADGTPDTVLSAYQADARERARSLRLGRMQPQASEA
ncbi:ABC transporter ATP-binding protein [Natronospirillum operosum]|uniref:ABC transporter ATP-binding protein n=1 Tax=Natronospirillum operosum TaxID=2759953 RepID=A0A4Z0WDM8_9GAMM|nr:ABC transporter ATP-binding protein [Natronospirillum operosum]TGG94223.1 ABC transporter ATP-binding protein [Natronospirillum operosum]